MTRLPRWFRPAGPALLAAGLLASLAGCRAHAETLQLSDAQLHRALERLLARHVVRVSADDGDGAARLTVWVSPALAGRFPEHHVIGDLPDAAAVARTCAALGPLEWVTAREALRRALGRPEPSGPRWALLIVDAPRGGGDPAVRARLIELLDWLTAHERPFLMIVGQELDAGLGVEALRAALARTAAGAPRERL